MKILQLKSDDPYAEGLGEDNIKMTGIHDLEDSELLELLDLVLQTLGHPNRKKVKQFALESISDKTGLLFPSQSKALSGLSPKNNILLFSSHNGNGDEEVPLDQPSIDTHTMDRIAEYNGLENVTCFIQVNVPDHFQSQIENYKKKLNRQKELAREKKKNREIAKAKKILAAAGELSINK